MAGVIYRLLMALLYTQAQDPFNGNDVVNQCSIMDDYG
jgi:hypothetical protein